MKPFRSINLGNWFVLERWMKPSLFEEHNVIGKDETAFSMQVEDLGQVLEEHYRTWITVEDLKWIKDSGFEVVRIPIPWWVFGTAPYYSSLKALDFCLNLVHEAGLEFMLDLHTAPGCQNGFDNGGIEGVMDWHKDQKNIDQTIDVLEQLAIRYKETPGFHSIQLLNEPHYDIDLSIVQTFYVRAYKRLRRILPNKIIVMHDSFRLDQWFDFFTKNTFHHVILDTHMYQCFSSKHKDLSVEEHIELANNRVNILQRVQSLVPVMVGEWSLGLSYNKHITKENINEVEKLYASAQLKAMKDCISHTFWNYKIENPDSGWNFRSLVDRGVIKLEEII